MEDKIRRNKKINIATLVSSSPMFNTVFQNLKQAKISNCLDNVSCVSGCPTLIKSNGELHRHIATKHRESYFAMCRSSDIEPNKCYIEGYEDEWTRYKNIQNNSSFRAEENFNYEIEMEHDRSDNDYDYEIEMENDKSELDRIFDEIYSNNDNESYDYLDLDDPTYNADEERQVNRQVDQFNESDFDSDYEDNIFDSGEELTEEFEIIKDDLLAFVDYTVDNISKIEKSRFFSELHYKYDTEIVKYAYAWFIDVIQNRVEKNSPFEDIKDIMIKDIDRVKTFPNFSSQTGINIFGEIVRFIKSIHLQNIFLTTLATYVPPMDLIINNQIVGQCVDIAKLCKVILEKNLQIIDSLDIERSIQSQSSNETINHELCCNQTRYNKLNGKIRFRIGADDFQISSNHNHKFLGIYLTISNFHPKDRLKRSNVYPIYLIERSKLKEANINIQLVLKKLADDFKRCNQDGIVIDFVNEKGEKIQRNIQNVVSAFCCDNSGSYEFLGMKKGFGNGFRCRYCGANKKESQSHEIRPLFSYMDPTDYQELFHKNGSVKCLENPFGLETKCQLSELGSIFNMFPPDPLHDLIEGAAKDLFLKYILTQATSLDTKKIVNQIENFKFINGKIKIHFESMEKGFKLNGAKAVQCVGTIMQDYSLGDENHKLLDRKAYSILLQCLNDQDILLVMGSSSMYVAWNLIVNSYEKSSGARVQSKFKELMNLKIEFGHLKDGVMKFSLLINEIEKMIGCKMNEAVKCHHLIAVLPDGLESVVNSFIVMKMTDLKFNDLKEAIMVKEVLVNDKSNVFLTNEDNCVMLTHKKFFGKARKVFHRNQPNQSFRGKVSRKCFSCGSDKHLIRDCKSNHVMIAETDLSKTSENYVVPDSFVAATYLQRTQYKNMWILDSGATDHHIVDELCFKKLDKCVSSVKCANGLSSPVKGIGEVMLSCKVDDVSLDVHLTNARFAPCLSCNLVSVRKLVEKGARLFLKMI
ncbi:hypothetical protein BLOT_005328 [Blomia tropicalis]|nr:hypothetical protein BLOT_005328 [Blomia tropicalis]